MKTSKITLGITTALLLSTSIYANEAENIQALKAEIQELREITQTLIDETSNLKTGFEYTTADVEKSYSGLGGAASKVYNSTSPLSIAGYGEMYYADAKVSGGERKRTLDVYRYIPFIGYRFSDNIILNTEIEFEHGGAKTGESGYVIVEFMYLDFLINKNLNIRVGNYLIPMGLISERHEPTLFATVQRPLTAKYLIPTTWNESGVMVYGDIIDNLSYKLAAFSALQTTTNGTKWIRDGRGGAFKQTDPALGLVARVDYTGINGLFIGASTYLAPSKNNVDSDILMADVHFDYKNSGLRVYGTYADISRSNAKKIAADAVEKANGGYVNFSYDVAALGTSTKSLPIFMQYESIDVEAKKADGTSGNSIDTITLGVNYFPHEQVVFKFEYAMEQEGSTDTDTTSISMGFIF